jgi:RNA-directed DNA polymerase
MHTNYYLVRWAMRKYKRLRRRSRQARRFLAAIAARDPDLFAHWTCGAKPSGWTTGAR